MRTGNPNLIDNKELADHVHESLPDCLVQDLFIAQAMRLPNRPAVISHNRTLSYSQLLVMARAWGLKLRGLGARPKTLVAIVMEKGHPAHR